MRLGLIGDIHGNADALSAVLKAADRLAVTTFCVTGDFVGYYHEPARVLRMLRQLDFVAVRGNHDDMLVACLGDAEQRVAVRRKYGSGIDAAIEQLEQDEIAFLGELPVTRTLEFGRKSVLLGHGSPWDTDTYIYPDAPEAVWQAMAGYSADYIVLGHTHHQYDRRIGDRMIINPGSVGQPRDRRPGAAWTILDTETDRIEHRREPYDMERVIQRAQSTDPHLPFIQTVLTRK